MPVLKTKKNGVWQDIASSYTHAHTVSDITDLPASLVDDVEALKDKVGADSVAYQISSVVQASEYVHPFTHPADMITGLSDVAISGDYNDLVNKPNIPSIVGLATETYVDEKIASIDVSGVITEQVQSDWDETDTTSPAYIKNKPVISGGGASVQANWNQNDEAAADFIKNKPFGQYEGLIDILPVTRYTDFLLDSTYGVYSKSDNPIFSLTIGETYTVSWDGVEYECVAQDASALMSGAVLVGNASAFGLSGNNEPFIIACITGLGVTYFSLTDREAGGRHDIRIAKEGIIVNHIDNKYLSFMEYVEPTQEYILPISKYTDFRFESDFNLYGTAELASFTLSIGETYTVSWDGVEYECVAQDASALMSGAVLVGNASAFGLSGNNEPFIIGCVNGYMAAYYSLKDTVEGGFHYIGISKEVNGYHVIKEECAPQSDWNNMKNKPFYMIKSGTTILEKQTVNCCIDNGGLYLAAIEKIGLDDFTYNVEFDGNDYLIKCEKSNVICLLEYNNNGIEFVIFETDANNSCLIMSTQGEHTIKITLAEDVIKKIDPIYLSTTLPEVTTDDNNKVLTVVNGEWAVDSGLPKVTTSDAGKFLRVNSDGVWVVDTVKNAEEVAF